ncbi:MAG TPA: DUF983 domain-containing protein [Dongiaceae bacterium]|nr:DUF983 domain-containing protein [Dongiaceae bacterium]
MEMNAVLTEASGSQEMRVQHAGLQQASLWTSLKYGFLRRCPRCGIGRMFVGYLTIAESCTACGLPFEPIRADDAPAYFTISIVGHIVVTGLLLMEAVFHPPSWLQAAIWLPATVLLSLGLLPFIKGAVMAAIHCSQRKRGTS